MADERHECGFCGWEGSPDWVTPRKGQTYGHGPGTEDMHLCQFCRRSFAASRWLSGGESTAIERDLLASMNLLRVSLLGTFQDG